MSTKPPTKKPPKKESKGGRPAVDWNALYSEWISSGKTKRDFLAEYGFKTTSSRVKQIIARWSKDEIASRNAMGQLLKSHRTEQQHTASLWQVVQQWRQTQAESDWKTANAIRDHCKLILNRSIEKDANGNPTTKLTPRDLVNLSDAMEKIQRIQRLALGMSTENIGVDRPSEETHVASDDTIDCPVFIVEVNDNGKFVRARPKQVGGIK